MRTRKQNGDTRHIFPEQLIDHITQIPYHPLTVVEAMSGSGKTTAIWEYFSDNLPQGAREHWYTCLGEPSEKAWDGVCELFGRVDETIALRLKQLEPPTMDTLDKVTLLLNELRCLDETFLIIDNYQLIGSAIPRELINALSMHGDVNLHIVVISQELTGGKQEPAYCSGVFCVDPHHFLFDNQSVAHSFRVAGIRVSEEALENMRLAVNGWPVAIRLQMMNYQKTGKFEQTNAIDALVETVIWNRLNSAEQEFLLSLSILDSFTLRQAAVMLDEKKVPENMGYILKTNVLISYSPSNASYTIHGILQDYLRRKFYYSQPEAFQSLMHRRAGHSCAMISDYYSAMRFFHHTADYESILSLPDNSDYMSDENERYIIKEILRLVEKCPAETLRQYPMSITTFAYQLFFFGHYEQFAYLCELVGSVLNNPAGLSADDQRRLAGEMEFIQSFTAYNDIEKMSAHHRAAYELLDGPSCYTFINDPWTFGAVSVLYMFWRKTGELSRELDCLDECLPYYIKLAKGHGTGANSVMRAEALLVMGKDDDAEALCHKAIYVARDKGQTSLCLSAELVLARIAMLRGNAEDYHAALSNIRRYAAGKPKWETLCMVDLCLSALSLTLDSADGVAGWLSKSETLDKNLFAAVTPYCHMIYGKLLLKGERYNELYGLSDLMLGMAQEFGYLLPQVYQLIYLAIAKENSGQTAKAREHLNNALEMALPDKIYLPFAEHGDALMPMLESVKQSVSDKGALNDIITLCKRQSVGMNAIMEALASSKSGLTPRERQIALLARDRLSVKEISEKLSISENTVKSALKAIYNKLNVNSKMQLNNIEF